VKNKSFSAKVVKVIFGAEDVGTGLLMPYLFTYFVN